MLGEKGRIFKKELDANMSICVIAKVWHVLKEVEIVSCNKGIQKPKEFREY